MEWQAISFLTEWVGWFSLLIIPGAGFMVAYQAAKKSMACDEETIKDCNKKIKMTIKGAIIAVTMGGTITVIKSYYGF